LSSPGERGLLLLLLRELYQLESSDLATEEDKAELRQLDCNLATKEKEDNFALLGGWLSETGARWKRNS
jgi:hypothetical protein